MSADTAVTAKTGIAIVTGVVSYLLGRVNELMVVLAILMVTDYILGSAVALVKGEFNYKKGILGAVKKLGYVFLVLFGFLADFTLDFLAASVGYDQLSPAIFGFAITCYLIGTEGLSNLKSLAVLGLPVPSFLEKAFGLIKDSGISKSEDKTNKDN